MCRAQQDKIKEEKENGKSRYKEEDGTKRTRRRRRETQSLGESSPGIASPAAFLADRTDLQFPPETGTDTRLSALSLGGLKIASADESLTAALQHHPTSLSAIKTYMSDSLYK